MDEKQKSTSRGTDGTRGSGEPAEWLVAHALPTGTVTFLFTDIQGSTPLWESQPELMEESLQLHNEILFSAIRANGGAVFKLVGDEFQASFPTAPQALQAAIDIQAGLQEAAWNALGPLKVRIGLHTGEAHPDEIGDEYAVSPAKNRVGRIRSAGHGGQILLSKESAGLCETSLPPGVRLRYLGEYHMKGLSRLEPIYQAVAAGLPEHFPPLATLTAPKNNLPLELTSFIGRRKETAAVCELLSAHRLVTLTGVGGTGKTRLALHAAGESLGRFPEGVWLVELAGLADPGLVARAILTALGLQSSPTQPALEQLEDYLEHKQALLLLDNCEHLILECARVAEALLLACPGVQVLASSREALGVSGEVSYPVPSLPFPMLGEEQSPEGLAQYAAVQLFSERARSVRPGFALTAENAVAVAQVCRRLDGIPLAIELAAARVSALSPQQIAGLLDDRFRLLTGGPRTAVPRLQTLRASIDWSYSLLEEKERQLLMRLSVFKGGWMLEQAVAVCGFGELDEFGVLDGLDQLVHKSLIYTVSAADGVNRYRRLETIRQYAWEQLVESGQGAAMQDRHLEAFLKLAEEAEPHLRGLQQVAWLDRLEVELDNLRAAVEWSLEGQVAKGMRLVYSLFWFWYFRGYLDETERWLGQLEHRAAQLGSGIDPVLLAEARAYHAFYMVLMGRAGEQPTRLVEQALRLAEDLGGAGKRAQCIAWYALAINAIFLGQRTKARYLFQQCLAVVRELGDIFNEGETLFMLVYFEPDPTKARAYAERNLAIRLELGDLNGLMNAQQVLGDCHFAAGDLAGARPLYAQSLQIREKIRDVWVLYKGYLRLGILLCESGEVEQAIEYLVQALAVARDKGDKVSILQTQNELGRAFGLQRDWSQAQANFRQAIEMAQAIQNIFFEATCCLNLAEVAGQLGFQETAGEYFQQAADLLQDQAGPALEGIRAYATAKLAYFHGDLSSARRLFQVALGDSVEQGDHYCMKLCLEALVACTGQADQFERAARLAGAVASSCLMVLPISITGLISFRLDDPTAPARAALGEDRYAQLYEAGKAMSLEEVVTYALESGL